MSFCQSCGAEIHENAVICTKCGCSIASPAANKITTNHKEDGLATASKVFLILGCILQGWLILPLAWCLPITMSIFERIKRNEPIGVGLKVCSLLFVNLIGGILLLCRSDENQI